VDFLGEHSYPNERRIDNNKKILRIKHGGKCNSVVGVCDVHGKCLPKEQNVMVNILSEDIIADIQSCAKM
jgi:hypothetical protein